MTTTPRDPSPLPDPDRDRDVHPFGHDRPTGPSPSHETSEGYRTQETHEGLLHPTRSAERLNGPMSSPPLHDQPVEPAAGGPGHRLLMLVCCVPMLVIVIALVASGVAGAGSIIFALLCVGMMAVMMFMMPGDHRH